MSVMRVGLAAIAALAFAASAEAKAKPDKLLNCPEASSEARMTALEDQLGSLEDRLDSLSGKLEQLSDARRSALDEAKDRIEAIVHDDEASPKQIDREVAKAVSEAEAKGEATAHAAQSVHRSMLDIKGQMEMLRQQMRALATHPMAKTDDAG